MIAIKIEAVNCYFFQACSFLCFHADVAIHMPIKIDGFVKSPISSLRFISCSFRRT